MQCVPLARLPLRAVAPRGTTRPTLHATGTPNRTGVQGRGRGSRAGGRPLDAPVEPVGVGWCSSTASKH